MLTEAYGKDRMYLARVFEQYLRLCEGCQNVEDDTRSRQQLQEPKKMQKNQQNFSRGPLSVRMITKATDIDKENA